MVKRGKRERVREVTVINRSSTAECVHTAGSRYVKRLQEFKQKSQRVWQLEIVISLLNWQTITAAIIDYLNTLKL